MTENEDVVFNDAGGTPVVVDYDNPDNTAYTDNNNAFIGYIGADTTNTALDTAPTNPYPANDIQTELYHFYLAWQNPDATGAVTYDGMEIKAYA